MVGYLLFVRNKPEKPAFTGPIEHLNVAAVGEYSSLTIIAQNQGFFKDNGVDVTITDYESGAPAVTDLLAGKVDIAGAADFVGVSNSLHGEDLKILASQARTDSFFIVARNDQGIKAPGDLKGKRIGVTHKTAGEFYLGEYLILNHINIKDTIISNYSPSELVNQLVAGKLDAVVTFDPHISNARNALGDKVTVWPAQGDEKLFVLLYATSKLTRERPEAVKRYLRALYEAEQFIESHDKETRAIIAKYIAQNDAYTQNVLSNLVFELSLDQDLLINMEGAARWLIANNLTDAKTYPDYAKLIYFDGLEAIKPDGITIIR